ncbi:MAG: DUF86 domain-containing protein [Vallitaleaceae bacterium]|nr:DUF86 domain-containing protein [Vallitaleaceae bacterium]
MKNDIIILKIIVYIDKILNYCQGHCYNSFVDSSMLVEASIFNLSQIGELANKLNLEYDQKYPTIPWRQLYGLRNRIVHDYDGVILSLVWSI